MKQLATNERKNTRGKKNWRYERISTERHDVNKRNSSWNAGILSAFSLFEISLHSACFALNHKFNISCEEATDLKNKKKKKTAQRNSIRYFFEAKLSPLLQTKNWMYEKRSDFNFPVFYLSLVLPFCSLIFTLFFWLVTGGNISRWIEWWSNNESTNFPTKSVQKWYYYVFLCGGMHQALGPWRRESWGNANRPMKEQKAHEKESNYFAPKKTHHLNFRYEQRAESTEKAGKAKQIKKNFWEGKNCTWTRKSFFSLLFVVERIKIWMRI